MKKIFGGLFSLIFSLFFYTCDIDRLLVPDCSAPHCEIIEIEKTDYRPGHFARIILTAINSDGPVAFYVACEIKLKKGNTIIERDYISFGTIRSGESVIDEAMLSKITTHDNYDYTEIKLFWYDECNNYYEKYY